MGSMSQQVDELATLQRPVCRDLDCHKRGHPDWLQLAAILIHISQCLSAAGKARTSSHLPRPLFHVNS